MGGWSRGFACGVAITASLLASRAGARPRGYTERTFTTKDGLAQSLVTALVQDTHGYLWVGTQNGLDRFDGVAFRRFGSDDGLASDVVQNLLVDHEGRVWVGGSGTLAVLEGERFVAIELPAAMREHVVRAIFDDGKAVYVGAVGTVARVTGARAEALPLPPLGIVNKIARDADGSLLIGHSKGLLRLRPDAHDEAAPVEGVVAALALRVAPDRAVWIGINGGLSVRANGATTRIDSPDASAPLRGIQDIVLDPDGSTMWIASANGVWRVGADHVPHRIAKTDGPVANIVIDREGDLWFDAPGGLYELAPAKIDAVTKDDGLPNENVFPVVVARDGSTWVGTSAGVAHIEGGRVTAYGTAEGVGAPLVISMAEDAKGHICAGGVPGPYCFDGKRFAVMGDTATSGMWVAGVATEADGTVLFTGRGLWKIGDHGVEKLARDLLGEDAANLGIDRAGNVWIGYASTAGVTLLSPDGASRHVTHASTPSMPAARVYGTMQDSRGHMWLGSDRGLLLVAGDHVTVFGRHAGFPDEAVGTPIEDLDGTLWAPTDHGLARFDGEHVTALYTEDDGLPASELSGGEARDRDGRLWFGTTNGIAIVDPKRMPTNHVAPLVLIEDVRAGDRTFAPSALPAEIAAVDNTLRFDFTATSLRRPRAMRFEYMLDGFDPRWTAMEMPVVQRRATYTNLPAGAYTFRVRATNDDGVWSETPAIVRFRVLAPWWRTWWALGAYACALVAVGAGAALLRTRGLRARATLLEVKVKERTNDLDQKVEQLAHKNSELSRVNGELTESHRRANRIFSALAEALPGTVLDDKYKLGERIGAGGFGAVFRATHLGLRSEVAVKVFRPAPGNDSAEALERFRREASTACRVKHPNAVNVFDAGISHEGIAYLVMELLVGESLGSEMERGRLSAERTSQVMTPACAALQAAHDAGIVHRDMKPENVFLHHDATGNEIVKVVDFGIARLVADEQGTQPIELTSRDEVLGTPAYLAPERLAKTPHDGRADVFSVAVMVYRMLSGSLPFESRGGAGSYLLNVLAGHSVRLRARIPEVPEAIESLVHRGLAVQPSLRPTAIELGRDLADLVAAMPEATRHAPFAVPNEDALDPTKASTQSMQAKPTASGG